MTLRSRVLLWLALLLGIFALLQVFSLYGNPALGLYLADLGLC